MPTQSLHDLAAAYSELDVYGRITQEFVPGCCIVASLVTQRVFRYFDCDTEILTTACGIYNRQYVQHVVEGGRVESEEEAERWAKAGCASLIIGHPELIQDKQSTSHLMNVVRRSDDLIGIDASIQQAHRPQKGITFEGPLVFSPANELVETGSQTLVWVDGCLIAYKRVKDKGHKTSPDWVSDRRWRHIAGEMIRQLEKVV